MKIVLLIVILFLTRTYSQINVNKLIKNKTPLIIKCKKRVISHFIDEKLMTPEIITIINNIEIYDQKLPMHVGQYIAGNGKNKDYILVNLEYLNKENLYLTIYHELIHCIDDKLKPDSVLSFLPLIYINRYNQIRIKNHYITTMYYSDTMDSIFIDAIDTRVLYDTAYMNYKINKYNIPIMWNDKLRNNIAYFSNSGEIFVRLHILKMLMKDKKYKDVLKFTKKIANTNDEYDFYPLILLMDESWINNKLK